MAASKRISSRPWQRLSRTVACVVAAIVCRSVTATASSRQPAAARLPADTVWVIERGIYAGTSVVLQLDAALSSRFRGEHFWRVASTGNTGGIVGWRTTRYPIPVAFRRIKSGRAVSSADSTAFWSTIDEMNNDLGMPVFTPATINESADPQDVIVVDVRTIENDEGLSRASWTSSGELFDVRVTFRDQSLLHDRHTVLHEMMHALGFGHTREWTSVVNPSNPARPSRLTPEDVAYTELAMRLREKRERADMRELIALAVERESTIFNGSQGYRLCDPESSAEQEEPMRNRTLLPAGLLTLITACAAGDKNAKSPDTIAVPAAAVDTSTDRVPGTTPRAEASPATGVDTPITRKLGSPAPVKK